MRVSLSFLGTGAPDVGLDDMSAVAFRASSSLLLLDSGEGVQHKLVRVGVGLNKLGSVLITHLHSDHVVGLIPLVQTRTLMFKSLRPLSIYGPPGLEKFLSESFNSLYFDPGNAIEIQELREHEEVRLGELTIKAEPLDHTVITLGYSISVDRGFSLCYLTDTRPTARDGLRCSILIHDSTFSWVDLEKAVEFKHTTALEAGIIASKVGAKLLFLYHISSRYRDRGFLESEARRFHPHTYAAEKYTYVNLSL
ncbi:MAG: MBL fold metallo-hydrolase [Sulfolobales archaeon]|nr:MBL fold metallo-hydrolase [Sulfolobales archaeon]MDW8082241.1 MBL fold metallo-hydrolase [Sulfolobales archaeon]